MKAAAMLGALLALAACAKPAQLPATLNNCSASLSGISANLRNDADRPIESVEITADFYADFRFVRTSGSVTIHGGLNPGDSKDVTFAYDAASTLKSGHASRCIATGIRYLDGTGVRLPKGAR